MDQDTLFTIVPDCDRMFFYDHLCHKLPSFIPLWKQIKSTRDFIDVLEQLPNSLCYDLNYSFKYRNFREDFVDLVKEEGGINISAKMFEHMFYMSYVLNQSVADTWLSLVDTFGDKLKVSHD